METIEVWVIMDENGDYAVAANKNDAVQAFEDDVGWYGAVRTVCLKLQMAKPKPIVVSGMVPDDDEGTVTLTVSNDK